MVDPNLKDAVWQVLEDYARRHPSLTLHSDLIIRKFPRVNEQELINAIGELIVDEKITAKASTVDAYGDPTAFHIRVRGVEERPGGVSKPPRGGVSSFDVGFGDTSMPPSPVPPEESEPPEEGRVRVHVGVDDNKTAPDRQPTTSTAPTAGARERFAAMREEAERNFEEELSSFFAELEVATVTDDDAKKQLTDQMLVLMAMFQSGEVKSFTTPLNKLAMLKSRVERLTPDLVGDYILLVQTAVRAWLAKV